MFDDSFLRLSDAQALTVTAASTNIVDLSIARNIGKGEPLVVKVHVNVAADFTTTDETYQFDLQTDDDVAFGTPTVVESRKVAAGLLLAGDTVEIPIPVTELKERYLRLNYVLAGTTPLITVTAFVQPRSMAEMKPDHYASGYTVS
jgi:hypothetical protein